MKTLLDLIVHEQCDESFFCEMPASLYVINGRSFQFGVHNHVCFPLAGVPLSANTWVVRLLCTIHYQTFNPEVITQLCCPSFDTSLLPQERGGRHMCAQVLLYPLTDYYLPVKPSLLTYDSGIYGVGFSGSCYKLGWDLLGDHRLSLCVRYIKALGLYQMRAYTCRTGMHPNCSKGNAVIVNLKFLLCHTGADREPYGKPKQPNSLAAVLQHADVSGVMHACLRLKRETVMYLPSQVMFCLDHSLYD